MAEMASGKGNDKRIRAWEVFLLIFVPFVGGWLFMVPGRPKAAQYLAVAYCSLISLSAFSAGATDGLFTALLLFGICFLPVLYFIDNRVIEKRMREKARSEELESTVKTIIDTEPRLMTEDDELEMLEKKYT